MRNLDTLIDEVLATPESVMTSMADVDARLYYRFDRATRVGDKYLCVVVKKLEQDAFVVTAYLTDRVKQGARAWPHSD